MPRIYPTQVQIDDIAEETLFVNPDAASTHIGLYGDSSTRDLLIDILASAQTLIERYLGYIVSSRRIVETLPPYAAGDYLVASQPRDISAVTPAALFSYELLYDPELVKDKRLNSNNNNRRARIETLLDISVSTSVSYVVQAIAGPFVMSLHQAILTAAFKMNQNRSLIEEPSFDLLQGTSLLLPQSRIISV